MGSFFRRLWYLLRRSRHDAELREELEAHRALRQARLERDGLTPAEAEDGSRRALGNVTLAREDVRGVWIAPLIDDFCQDLRLSGRRLVSRPVFASAAILTFGLGIGANTAVFSVAETLLLRQLPVPRPDELFSFVRVGARERGESFSFPAFAYVQSNAHSLGDVAGYATRLAHVTANGREVDVGVHLVSGGYFRVLQVAPSIGRALDDVNEQDAPAVAVVSDAFQHRYLSPEVSAIGALVTINDAAYTVVGVMPRRFEGLSLDAPADVWLSIRSQPQLDGSSALESAGSNWVRMIARLPGGLRHPPHTDEGERLAQAFKASWGGDLDIRGIDLVSASRPDSGARDLLTAPLALMLVVVALVLLVACINIAYLLHARATARAREFAIQAAIGASRARLARQLVTETMLLAVIGGTVGIAFASLGTRGLLTYIVNHAYGAFQTPEWLAMEVNPAILVFTATVAVLAGLATGGVPARRAGSADLVLGLRSGSCSTGDRHAARGGHRLVAGQLTLSLLLVAIAGTFIQSFRDLRQIDLGFRPEGLSQFDVAWGRPQLPDSQLSEVASEILEDLQHTPGVTAASMSVPGVFSRSTWQATVSLPASLRESLLVPVTSAAPGYLSTLGVVLRRGRDFSPEDTAQAPPVVILSEAAARTLFPGTDPIGRDVRLYGAASPVRVIGVATDIRLRDVLAPPPPLVYVPYLQGKGPRAGSVTWTLRSALPAAALARQVERVVHSKSPTATVRVRAVVDVVGESVFLERTTAWLTGLFGLLGLGLAVVGTYGVVSFKAQGRIPEVGLRLALGATPSGIRRQMWSDAMKPIALGLGIGGVLSVGAIRVISGYFQGLSAAAPVAVASALFLLMSTAALACFVPVLWASKGDPASALRCE
jgi:putative ABC transport system permease protein